MRKYNEDFTTIPAEVYDKIKKATEELGCAPIMVCRLTNHPEDSHLYAVLAQYIEPYSVYGKAYCVWDASANESRGEASLYWGHYGLSFKAALNAFNEKVRDLNHER